MTELIDRSSGEYFRKNRASITQYLSKGANRVLDVGCGAGYFGAYMKQNNFAAHVTGIELNKKAADEASRNLDHVYCVDLNKVTIAETLNPSMSQQFEYITCNDVLEHLIDPWQALYDLTKLLTPNGRVIASIPNVRHWSVLVPLVFRGEWKYQDAGIMDRTHLRFFTKSSILQMFEAAGLDIIELHPLTGGKWKLIDKYSMHMLREFVAIQWIIVGKCKINKF